MDIDYAELRTVIDRVPIRMGTKLNIKVEDSTCLHIATQRVIGARITLPFGYQSQA